MFKRDDVTSLFLFLRPQLAVEVGRGSRIHGVSLMLHWLASFVSTTSSTDGGKLVSRGFTALVSGFVQLQSDTDRLYY